MVENQDVASSKFCQNPWGALAFEAKSQSGKPDPFLLHTP
jgi:hypothetical protein